MRCLPKETSKLLKAARERSPFSQTELSALLGYKNGQFISNVERGLCNPPTKMLVKYCHYVGISVEELKTAMLKDFNDNLDQEIEKQINAKQENPYGTLNSFYGAHLAAM